VFGIFLSQFLIWSVACGEVLDGVQGRYFLPLLPLALTLPAFSRFKVPTPVVIGVAALCNVAALIGIARYFW
jgi:uncharacterized membrane protein